MSAVPEVPEVPDGPGTAPSPGRVGGVDEALAAMDAALDFLHAAPAEVFTGRHRELLVGLTARRRRLDAAVVGLVGRFDADAEWSADGAASSRAWLRANLRLTPGAARATVRTATRLSGLPVMAEAFAAGRIDAKHVEVVAKAADATPARRATIGQAEPTFAQAAAELDPAQLARVVAHWAHTVDPHTAEAAQARLHQKRFVSVSATFDGAVALSGLLDPEGGAVVMAALEALGTCRFRAERADRAGWAARAATAPTGLAGAEETTPGQRRADALVDLARGYLDSGAAPQVKSVRPHLLVSVDHTTLTARRSAAGQAPAQLHPVGSGRAGRAAGGPVSVEAARRVGCDAEVTGFTVDCGGMPVAYGRTQRVVPAGLRRFLALRDGGCRFPGCDRPAGWCEAHHLVHWAHGGTTDHDNLVLLCSHHHHRMHEGGFTARGSPDTELVFQRPDRTRLGATRPRRDHRWRAGPADEQPG